MSDYEVVRKNDGYEVYELMDRSTNSSVRICPERGGIAIGFSAGGRELFYLDETTYRDRGANIRGGNPVLFPICGPLDNGRYEWDGQAYEMKQHGFARNAAWEVLHTDTEGAASLTLRLRSNDWTSSIYPFDFEIVYVYTLRKGVLTLRQTYANLSDRDMPFYAGFHPYFATEDKNPVYRSDATRCLDMNDAQEKPFDGRFDLTSLPESVILLDASRPSIAFGVGDGTIVTMEYSEAFKYVVLWSTPGKPYLCVEPWMAKPGELNRKQELPMIRPRQQIELELSIRTNRA